MPGESGTHGMTISVVDIAGDSRDLNAFLSLPSEIYRGDSNYCARHRDTVVSGLRRSGFADTQRVFLAREAERTVARVVARRSAKLTDDQGTAYGMLGFFESLDRPQAVQALFKEATSWLRSTGAGPVIGPMDGDTWHSYRLSIGPFDLPPFLLEPYNPPYYGKLWERCGFTPLETYFSKQLNDIPSFVARLERHRDRALAKGYSMRPMNMSRFRQELELLYDLSLEIFAGNFLYTDISLDDFLDLYEGTQRLIDPDLILFAHAADGAPAGFIFAYPDLFRAVAAMRGSRGLMAGLKFLMAKGRPTTINFKSLGVVPAHRRTGIDAALTRRVAEEAVRKGYDLANLCLIREGNASGALAHKLGIVLRRYVLYEFAG